MATPAGVGILALLDLPDPCVLGTDNDVAAYTLAARILTSPDAPAEWNEPQPVICIDLRAALGSRLDRAGLDEWQARANEALGQADEVESAAATLTFAGGVLRCVVQAVGSAGPFAFVISIDSVSAQILRGA